MPRSETETGSVLENSRQSKAGASRERAFAILGARRRRLANDFAPAAGATLTPSTRVNSIAKMSMTLRWNVRVPDDFLHPAGATESTRQKRTRHRIHRPPRDIIPPAGGALVLSSAARRESSITASRALADPGRACPTAGWACRLALDIAAHRDGNGEALSGRKSGPRLGKEN